MKTDLGSPKSIDTPFLRIRENCLELQNTTIQLSNISLFSTADITPEKFPMLRACLKNVKTPKRRIFFRCTALKNLEIHKVFLRFFALSIEKISHFWSFRHLSNKP